MSKSRTETLTENGTSVPSQFAALCVKGRRRKRILLITSMRTERWIPPKGWIEPGESAHEAALRESWEEAGVIGKAKKNAIGSYESVKEISGSDYPCLVEAYLISVRKQKAKFPEAGKRKLRWVTPKTAAEMVQEPGLRRILVGLKRRRFSSDEIAS